MDIDQFISKLADVIVNPIIRLLFAVAIVVFLWGIFQYIRGAGNEEARATGRRHIIWGLIGLFVMVSVFAIIRIVMSTVFS